MDDELARLRAQAASLKNGSQVPSSPAVAPAPSGDNELTALRAEAARRRETALSSFGNAAPSTPSIPEGTTLVGTFADNGRVYRRADGTMAAVSAGAATSDPDSIKRIMDGDGFAAIVESSVDRQRIAENPIAARLNEVVRGVPFIGSYADEVVGLASPQAAENMRATSEAMQRENPYETLAANVTGAVAGTAPAALAAGPALAGRAATSILGRALQGLGLGAAAGGIEGGVYGSGEGQGGEERLAEAVEGAKFGAGAGAAFGAIGGAAQGGIKAILSRMRGVSDEKVIAQQLGISPGAAVMVKEALSTGGVDDAAIALRGIGDGAMLADAGEPARTLLDSSSKMGGRAGQIARQAVGERTRAETDRMTADLDRILGAPQGERELITAARKEGQPQRAKAYDTAYAAPIDYSGDAGRNLEALIKRVPARAVRQAQELMAIDGSESAQRIARIDTLPGGQENVTFDTLPDVEQIHLIMQGLDDVARNADGKGALGGNTRLGRSYANLRRDLSDTLSDLVPEFSTAQGLASDAIANREAIELGYNLLKTGTRREDVAEAVVATESRETRRAAAGEAAEEMTPQDALAIYQNIPRSERTAARQGLRSYIDDTTANVARTITDPDTTTREGIKIMRDMSSRSNRAKLRMILGEDAAEEMLDSVDRAATAFELRAAMAMNSKTAIHQAVDRAATEQTAGGPLRVLAKGEYQSLPKRITMAITGEGPEVDRLRKMGLYEEIATALTSIRGRKAEEAMSTIQRAMNGQSVSDDQANVVATVLALSPVFAPERASRSLPARQARNQ